MTSQTEPHYPPEGPTTTRPIWATVSKDISGALCFFSQTFLFFTGRPELSLAYVRAALSGLPSAPRDACRSIFAMTDDVAELVADRGTTIRSIASLSEPRGWPSPMTRLRYFRRICSGERHEDESCLGAILPRFIRSATTRELWLLRVWVENWLISPSVGAGFCSIRLSVEAACSLIHLDGLQRGRVQAGMGTVFGSARQSNNT